MEQELSGCIGCKGCVDGKLSEVCNASAEMRNFVFQAEDGIRDLVRSRGLGDVYKRQISWWFSGCAA